MTTTSRVFIPVQPAVETGDTPQAVVLETIARRPPCPSADDGLAGALTGFAEAGLAEEGRKAVQAVRRLGTLRPNTLWGIDVSVVTGGHSCCGDGLVLGFALALAMAALDRENAGVFAIGGIGGDLAIMPAHLPRLRRSLWVVETWLGAAPAVEGVFFVPAETVDAGPTATAVSREIAALARHGLNVVPIATFQQALIRLTPAVRAQGRTGFLHPFVSFQGEARR